MPADPDAYEDREAWPGDPDALQDHEYPDPHDCECDDDMVRACPQCAADIYADAEKCPECGAWLVADTQAAPLWRWLAVMIAVVLIVALILPAVL